MVSQDKEIAWVHVYPNKHVLDIFTELEKRKSCKLSYYFFDGIIDERCGQGWYTPANHEIIPRSFGFVYFRRIWDLLRSDVCVLFGSVDPFPWMYVIFLLAANFRSKVYFISEGLKYKPNRLKKLISSVLTNRRSVCYLSVGAEAAEDFYELGMTQWTYRRFAFAEKYENIEPFERMQKNEVVILGVGRLIPRKNFSKLIELMSRYRGSASVYIRIAGQGEEADYLTQLAEDNFPENVTLELLGLCDASALDLEFRNADMFVICSHYDGWGAVVNQAVAYGLPIVASKSVRSAPSNLVEDGVNGWIYSTDVEFESSIFSLLDNAQLRQEMSNASFSMACNWSVEEIASRLEILFGDDDIEFEQGILERLDPARTV